MPTLKTQCPTCEVLLETDSGYNGKAAQCPECEEPFTISPIESLEPVDAAAPMESVYSVEAEEAPQDLRAELLGESRGGPSEAAPAVAEAESPTDTVEAPPLVTPRRPQRSKTPLIVGSVAAVLFLAVVLAVVMNSGDDKPNGSPSKSGETEVSKLPKGDSGSRPANNQETTKVPSQAAQPTEGARTTQNTGGQQASAKPKQETKKMAQGRRRKKEESSYLVAKASFDNEEYNAAATKLREFIDEFRNSEHLLEVKELLSKAKVERKKQKKYEKLYDDADKAFEREDYEPAIEKLSRITKDYPNSAVSSQAEDLLKKARTKHAEKLYNKGEAAYSEKRYRDAIDPFEQLIERYSKREWSAEWCAKAKSRLETVYNTLIERIASDAWVVYGEYKDLNQAGWVSDERRKLEEIVRDTIVHDNKKWSWATVGMGASTGKLSKDQVRLKLVERKSADRICYLSEQAKKQIRNKVLAEGEWLTPEQAKERGMTEFRGQWYTSMGLLNQQVMIGRINAKRFFAVRRFDFFDPELARFHGKKLWNKMSQPLRLDTDRTDDIPVMGGPVHALDGFGYDKVESFQPGSDKENRWVAAKATVVVSYNLNIPVYRREKPAPLSAMKWVEKDTKKTKAQKGFICLLIQENKAIRRFLDSKKGAGELIFDKGIYQIPRPNPNQPISRLYQQSIFFENRRSRNNTFVIAVIYSPEFKKVFRALKMHMSKPQLH